MDFNEPANLLKAMVKLRGSLDGASSLWWYRGNQYGIIDMQPTLLWQVEGAQLGKYVQRDDGSWDHVFRDVMFYLEPRSGELMERYENPWTGETNEPPAMKMGPYRNRHTVTGAEIILPDNIPPGMMEVSWDYEPVVVQGDHIFIREQGTTKIANPAAAAEGSTARSHFFINDFFTLEGRVSDVMNDAPSAPATTSYTSVNEWTPWMNMGDRPGWVLGRGNTVKLESFADLSERLTAWISDFEPSFFEDPDFPVWDKPFHPLNQ